MVILTSPLNPGCVVWARTIAFLMIKDEKGQDEKALAVNVKDVHHSDIMEMKDTREHVYIEISDFGFGLCVGILVVMTNKGNISRER